MLAGGFDDLSEEGSYEFANMKATSNAETEFAMGREPTEMSRPTTTTRSGVGNFRLWSVSALTIAFIVHGISGHRCSGAHERKDRPRARCSYSWNNRLHLDLHVSSTSHWT